MSSTVRDLVAGSGISLRERGTDGAVEWQLFSAGAAAVSG